MPSRLWASPHRAFLLVYGAAHGAKSLIWHASEILFAFFLTEAIRLPPSQVGLMLGASLVLNALMDLSVGWTLRRRVRDSAGAARLQGFGAGISALMLLAFAATSFLPNGLRLGFALTSLLAFRLAYPFYDNPQNALLTFTTRDDGGRARLAATRYVSGGAARLVLAISFAPMMIGQTPLVQSHRFSTLCLGMALAAVVTAGGLAAFVNRRPDILVSGRGNESSTMATEPKRAVSLVGLLAIAFTLSISSSVFGRLEPYFASFAIRQVASASVMLSAATLGSLLSQGLWAHFAQRLALTDLLRVALVVLGAGAGLLYLLAPLGLPWSAGACALYGVGSGGVFMALWSLLAGRAASSGAMGGTAAFGLYTCFSKLGLACAAVAMGAILASVDYRDQVLAMGPVFGAMAGAPVAGALVIGLLTARFRARPLGLPSLRPATPG